MNNCSKLNKTWRLNRRARKTGVIPRDDKVHVTRNDHAINLKDLPALFPKELLVTRVARGHPELPL